MGPSFDVLLTRLAFMISSLCKGQTELGYLAQNVFSLESKIEILTF